MPNIFLSDTAQQLQRAQNYRPATMQLVIADTPSHTVLDSGSSLSAISFSFYSRLNAPPPISAVSPMFKPTAANNEPLDLLGFVTLPLRIHDRNFSLKFYVIRAFPYSALLGNDAFDMLKPTVDYNTLQFTVSGCPPIPFSTITSQIGKCFILRSDHIFTVDGRTRNVVSISTDTPTSFDYHLFPATSRPNRHKAVNVTVPHILTRITDKKATIEILNPHKSSRRIYKGQILGVLEYLGEQESTFAVSSPIDDQQDQDADFLAATSIPPAKQSTPTTAATSTSNNPVSPEAINSRVDSSLNAGQRGQLQDLLHSFADVFAQNPKSPNAATTVAHHIDTSDARPIRQTLRYHGPDGETFIDSEVKSLLKDKLIQPSESEWISNVVLVRKKDGTTRFCIDYRALNNVTRKLTAPIPNIRAALDVLSGSSWFSALDLASGYWQVPMHADDIKKTAFITRNGVYEWTRMPFGLTGAVATFQNAMNSLLSGLTWKICLVYLDDVLIFSSSFDRHLDALGQILQRFRESKFQLKLDKCRFGARQLRYLGFLLSEAGIQPDPRLIQKIADCPTPTDARQAHSFVQLCNYYSSNIPHFADIAEPLQRLNRKNVAFTWTNTENTAFLNLKKALISAPCLSFPNFDLDFVLDTDASKYAIGAVLAQLVHGREVVIAYFSKTLTEPQRVWDTTQREAYAVVKGINRFRHYLEYRNFRLRTDHSALQTLKTMKDPYGRIARWLIRIQSVDFTPLYRPGDKHSNADAMTRPPIADINARESDQLAADVNEYHVIFAVQRFANTLANIEHDNAYANLPTVATVHTDTTSKSDSTVLAPPSATTENQPPADRQPEQPSALIDQIRKLQPTDAFTGPILRHLRNAATTNRTDFTINNGLLYRIADHDRRRPYRLPRLQLCVPLQVRPLVLKQLHDSHISGHAGIHRFHANLVSVYYWPNFLNDITDWVNSCDECQRNKKSRQPRYGMLRPLPVPYHPFHTISLDFYGPLPKTERGNQYICSIVDHCTRYKIYAPTKDASALSAAKALYYNVILRFGAFSNLLSDRAKAFLSDIIAHLCRWLDARKIFTSGYHPQTNSVVERPHADLTPQFRSFGNVNKDDWDELAPEISFFENNAVNSSLNETPFFLVHGFDAAFPTDAAIAQLPATGTSVGQAYVRQLVLRLQLAREAAGNNIRASQLRNKKYYDINRIGHTFVEGQLVTIPLENAKNKLDSVRHGPYRIVRRSNDALTYWLRLVNKPNQKPITRHVSKLRHYVDRAQFPAFRFVPNIGNDAPPAAVAAPDVAIAPNIAPITPPPPIAQLAPPQPASIQQHQAIAPPLPPTLAPTTPAQQSNPALSNSTNPKQREIIYTLKNVLRSDYETLNKHPNFNVPKYKKTLLVLLDAGSIYIKSYRRNALFKLIIKGLETREQVLEFLHNAVTNFDTVFEYELNRGSN
jgi:transposase InsO family protein